MSNNLRKWRSEQIAMKFLYASYSEIRITKSPIPLFGLFATLDDNSFFVVVESSTFTTSNRFHSMLMLYKKNNMLNLPVLLFCINSNTEDGYVGIMGQKTSNGIKINENIKLRTITTQSLRDEINKALNLPTITSRS